MIVYILAGWLACSVGAYLVWRHDWRKRFGWTRGDRRIALLLCAFGPFALIAAIMTSRVAGWIESGDPPAKW